MLSKSFIVLIIAMGISLHTTACCTTKQAITSSALPAAIAPYSQAILSTATSGDQTLYMSGILPMRPSKELVDDPTQATTLVMDHITALLNEASMNWSSVVDVLILVRDINDFKAISDSYGVYLQSQGVTILPVRACFQAGKLPLNAVVEIKAMAVK